MASLARTRALQRFHLFGLVVVLVVVAEQMQQAVDDEMGDMVRERLAFQCGLARDRLGGEHDVAQHRRQRRRLAATGKPGKDRTLVGLSLPRHSAFSARIWASSVKTTLSSAAGRPAGPSLGERGADRRVDQAAKLGFVRPVARLDQDIDLDRVSGRVMRIARRRCIGRLRFSPAPRPRAILASRS